MLIAIPSMGRADIATSYDMIAESGVTPTMFVPESQYAEYKKRFASVVAIPDDIRGITRARNFILDYADAHGEKYIMQCDDDARVFFKFENKQWHKIPNKQIAYHVEIMFQLCADMRTVLWGFQLTDDRRNYREFQPFSTTSVIVASCMGIIADGTRFDENLALKEDYDFSLQILRKYRRVIRSNKYIWRVEHQVTRGGCSQYRSMQAELDAIDYLQKKWGTKVVRVHPRKPFEIIVRAPIKGV